MKNKNILKNSLFFIFTSMLILSSCVTTRPPVSRNTHKGMASWYGPDFHGKSTSSKEIFNMHEMTAAHKTLPFNTYVMVTNLNNGKSVIVRINDRGPFVKGRIIDLSYAAAKVIDMIGQGIVPVRIEILEGKSYKKLPQKFSIQVGSFIIRDNASNLKKLLQKKYKNIYISTFKTRNHVYYRVRIPADSQEEVNNIARKLQKEGYNIILLEER